jgi:hypothetical protein
MRTSKLYCLQYLKKAPILISGRFNTYFPHIDNVYSHRSTQRHKRKRFVSHYWDCRLKGRPPGTKKSTDPDKKKRKRVARERDLCDVKIKITEYFDQDEYADQVGHRPPGAENENRGPISALPTTSLDQNQQFFAQAQMMQRDVNGWDIPQNLAQFATAPAPVPLPRAPLRKYYTFQRVNGNGGNGKGDGVAGPHKHTLEESDRVKKNSVLRWLAKCEKDSKKSQVSYFELLLSSPIVLKGCMAFPCFTFFRLSLRKSVGGTVQTKRWELKLMMSPCSDIKLLLQGLVLPIICTR